MLIDEPIILQADFILDMIARANGNGPGKRIQEGVFEIGHFGGSYWPGKNYERCPHLPCGDIDCVGVCDNLQQLLEYVPEVISSERKFVITLTKILKRNQSPTGGWRWHKWGPYIGTQNPQHEYLYDEENIKEVFVYHIMEQIN